jgi:large subunit ribosomal protein L11
VVTVYADRSFSFITKSPPASFYIKKAAGVEKGNGEVGRTENIGSVTMVQLREIADAKKADLNANDVDAACRILAGTARSMGIDVVE